ncbi:MAG TPA: MFS transporter [Caulobacteraceae bacterium]|jgi:YNFM family putative membrane transporter|nr:MFS transporter [Caulobacteraceae bacterium]
MSETVPPPAIVRGTPAFRRMNLALVAGGLATFAQLYSVQPLLPVFARTFHLDAASASLAVSVASMTMAAALLFTGVVADRTDRRLIMVTAMVAAALLTLAASVAPTWPLLLAARALTGLALAGVPAVALTYIGEEVDAGSIGLAVGMHIGGNVFGGMAGRLVMGVVADQLGWRVAIAMVGVLGLAAAILMGATLPPSRRFQPRTRPLGAAFKALAIPFRDKGLPWLFLLSFLCMGAFITVYNYIGFRLLAPPYNLSQSVVGLVFVCYLLGMVSSAFIGDLAGKLGRRKVLWAAIAGMGVGVGLTAFRSLPLVVLGIAVLTFAFFAVHSVASSWVGRRAGPARAEASAIYLFCYYLGASVVGTLGGYGWTHFGWTGVVGFLGALLVAALAVSVGLAFLQPLPGNEPPARKMGRKAVDS